MPGWMEGPLGGVLGFVVALIPLILLHEFGHFLMAKKVGVWVREFGIGYPPRILTLFKHRETEYTLNWLPLGGFVRLEGELMFREPSDSESEQMEPEEGAHEARAHSLYAKPPGQRILIYLGGPLMNLVVAWLLAVVLLVTGIPGEDVSIQAVAPGSPAEAAGLRPGDIVRAVNEVPVVTLEDLTAQTQAHLGEPVTLTLVRSGETVTCTLVPRPAPPEGEGPMGVIIGYQKLKRYSLPKALVLGGRDVVLTAGMMLMLPFYILRVGIPLSQARPVGVVGISRLAQHSIQVSLSVGALYPLLENIVLLSISLAVFNLLPIPALDGGRILLAVVEKVRARPLTPELEERIHTITMAVLVVLFLFITALDILVPVEIP